MSNWVVNIEHMLLVNVGRMRVNKIKYVEEKDMVYHYWNDGKYDGWCECIPEIIAEYKKQRDIVVERLLLEEQ